MAHKNDSNGATIPSWMADVKEDAIKTQEWNDLTRSIYDVVEQHLSQSHVSYFTDLTDAEKNLLLERAARSLIASDGGRVYENLQSKLSYLLDQTVNNIVARRLMEDSRQLDTKTDLVLDTASEGIVSLLRKHPDQKYKLRVFLNQVLPQPIRFLAWQLFFSNINYRKVFLNKLATNPKLCLSPQDPEIQRRCESLLNAAVTFKEMRDSRGNLNSMKGILSYYHTTLLSKRGLTEAEYLYSAPIVYSHHPSLPKNESPTERSMGMLIEIYMQFIHTLPNGIVQTLNGFTENVEMDVLIKSVANIIEEFDEPLIFSMKSLAKLSSAPGIEEITFQTAFKSICLPLLRNIFAGYLSLNPLMYVWDQYVISADVPGYHEELIPVIGAIIFMILREQLLACRSIGELDETLKNQSTFIQTRQIQTIFNKYFFKNLQTKLNSTKRVGPVIDPTIGRLQPWEHWHQDVVPKRAIRTREVDDTDDRLQAEVNRRIQSEKAARDEIERLRRELENMRKREAVKEPSKEPGNPIVKPASPGQPQPMSQDPILDILNKMNESINFIAHGDGSNLRDLNQQTSEDLKLHKLDLKIAEKQVFGRQLNRNEWDSMSEFQKKSKSEEMLEIVKYRLQKRFKETGRF